MPSTNYKVDGYCKHNMTVYSFFGDFYHGNPNVYKRDFYNKLLKKTMGELYDKTIIRENKIKSLGVYCYFYMGIRMENIKKIIKVKYELHLPF